MKKLPKKYYFNLKDFPLAIRKVEGNRVSHLHDYTGIPHYHNFSELVLITGGRGEQSVNGKFYPIVEGDIFIISGENVHYFTDYQNLRILNVMFDPSILGTRIDYLRKIPGYNLVFKIEPSLRTEKNFKNMLHLNRSQIVHAAAIIEDIEKELENHEPGYEAEAAAQFVRLIVYLSRNVGSKNTDRSSYLRLSVLLSSLEERFSENWTLDDMAHSVNMSKNNFIRVFKAAENCTPMKYLNRLRLDAACRFLREKKRRISEIAYLCGFRDSNYFSKSFSAAFKISPKEYRKRS